jgi:flagellin
MTNIRATLVKLADDNLSTDQRTQYQAQYTALAQAVTDFVNDATYNGKSLIGSGVAAAISTTRNENGTVYNIGSVSAANLIVTAAPTSAVSAQAMLGSTGNFATVMANLGNALNTFGNHSRYVDSLISYNKEKVDALESGVGALLDADLAKESARMQSLQIRQQLGTNALSMANQAPQSLLGLFR